MHQTSDWKPSQPVAFAWVLCLLMLGGEIVSGGPRNPMALVFYCFLPAALWMISHDRNRAARELERLNARVAQLEDARRGAFDPKAIVVCIALLTGGTALPAAEPPVPGGWSKAAVDDKGVVDAAAFAIQARQKAMKAAGEREVVELVRIARARQQVVAGMNYHLTLQVKRGDVVEAIEVVVWVQPWLAEDERSKLTSWKVLDDADAGPADERKPDRPPLPGK